MHPLPLEADDDPQGPPHKPLASDHATLWLDDGEPAVYSMHVYPGNIERLNAAEPPYNLWFDLFEFAAEWGLTEDAITEDGLYQIADRAVGDARVAIGILRKPAREASQANDDHISSETIVDVVLEAKMELKQKPLNWLAQKGFIAVLPPEF